MNPISPNAEARWLALDAELDSVETSMSQEELQSLQNDCNQPVKPGLLQRLARSKALMALGLVTGLGLGACRADYTIVPHGDGGTDSGMSADASSNPNRPDAGELPQQDAGVPQQDSQVPDPPEPECGDGIVDPGEECDDGNTTDGDGCPGDCLLPDPPEPECGDGIVDPGEECDDGNTVSGDGCDSGCLEEDPVEELCGNGTVDISEGEQCDDGNTTSGDGCDSGCQIEF
jgi:cysteine-rich repeat protein